jgi:hypothetical protein
VAVPDAVAGAGATATSAASTMNAESVRIHPRFDLSVPTKVILTRQPLLSAERRVLLKRGSENLAQMN